MWVEELRLQNIKCFENETIQLGENGKPYPWVTFLSENGGGKTTALQALALLLAGIYDAQGLLRKPIGWPRDQNGYGEISLKAHYALRINSFNSDPEDSSLRSYSYQVDENKLIEMHRLNSAFSYTTVEWSTSPPIGWFAAGYGAFRRLTRSVGDAFDNSKRYSPIENFQTQFDEDKALASLDAWLFQLDYRLLKENDKKTKHFLDVLKSAINNSLPGGVKYLRVATDGQMQFEKNGLLLTARVLSDGYRTVLALIGDLVYRLCQAFPDSDNPLEMTGVVLIDELDIHLHPTWQRDVASLLREQFPNIQFIVATHSPLIAAGAGKDAVAYKFEMEDGKAQVRRIDNLTFKSVDNVLTSDAFGLVSPFSPQAQEKIDDYDDLAEKGSKRTDEEDQEFEELRELFKRERPFRKHAEPGSLEARIDAYLDKTLK